MSNRCLEHHSQYIYSSSAYALAGEFYRPVRKSVPVQGGTVLGTSGGYYSQRLGKYFLDDLVSFESAQVEVGGSYDACHDFQTTYFTSVIEGLNIANMVTADRVVARTMVYSPAKNYDGEHTFDITGSYFDNLRIAGKKIDVSLNTGAFHAVNSYSELVKKCENREADELLFLNSFRDSSENELKRLEEQCHPLRGLSQWVSDWKKDENRSPREHYLCSAANHLNLEQQVTKNSELKNSELNNPELQSFGGVIFIHKFGVVRLAEVLVSQRTRRLTMLTVQMGSVGSGTVTCATGSTGGGNGLP
jgi:hypothetical protein